MIGDILNIEFRGAGRAIQGIHPAILVAYDLTSKMASVVPLTSTDGATRFPSTIMIRAHSVNGLTNDSVALVFQVTTIDPNFIKGKRGCLNPTELAAVKTILKSHLQIP